MVIERYLDHTGNLEGRGHTLPTSVFKHISAEKKAELLLELFIHYRRVGYPHQPTEDEWRESQWRSLMKTDPLLLDGRVVKQTMVGLPLAWSFHRHAVNVQVGTNQSCMEAFKDDEHFKAILKYRMNTGGYFNNAGLRKALKIHTGVQGVSNFRPTAASTIYLHFLKDVKNSVVWDCCAGFSGRLLGACLAGVGKYIGCDPCTLTYDGLKKTKSFIQEHKECRTEIILKCMCAEDFPIIPNAFDLVFTSPPYFNTERYSYEPDQSWVRYNTPEKWLNGFLREMMVIAFENLKPGSPFVLNIANVITYPDLVEDARNLGIMLGFQYLGEMKYTLSSMPSSPNAFKYEPLLIFYKN